MFNVRSKNALEKMQSIDNVEKALTFTKEEVRRGAGVNQIFAHAGRIFENSKGSAATYALSFIVETIDIFISHNWLVSRFRKFLVLALMVNLNKTGMAVVVVACLGLLLNYTSAIPPTACRGAHSDYTCVIPVSLLLWPAVILVGVLFSHELLRFCRVHGKTVFLDKVCIHQVDKDLQAAGIKSLGAFLRVSDTMLVVYTDLYLQKLWTVYELGTFFLACPYKRIVVVPVGMPLAAMGMAFIAWITELTYYSAQLSALAIPQLVSFVLSNATSIPLCYCMRVWARERAMMHIRAKSFSVRNAMCFDEKDRTLVQSNIIDFLKVTNRIEHKTDDDTALDVFDSLVRNNMANVLERSLGRAGVPYRLLALICSTHFVNYFDYLGLRLREGYFMDILVYGSNQLCYSLFTGPLVFVFGSITLGCKPHWRGWKEWLMILIAAAAVMVGVFGLRLLPTIFAGEVLWAEENDARPALKLIAFYVAMGLLTYFFYAPRSADTLASDAPKMKTKEQVLAEATPANSVSMAEKSCSVPCQSQPVDTGDAITSNVMQGVLRAIEEVAQVQAHDSKCSESLA